VIRDITLDDLPLVGGMNASRGELHRELSAAAVRVPDGCAATAGAYRAIVEAPDSGRAATRVRREIGRA
jgi:pyruvate,water dikinase